MIGRKATRALLLLLASAALAAALEWVGIPAGLLLGPMIAGIAFAVRGWTVTIPAAAFRAAQALVGVLIAGSIDADLLSEVGRRPSLFAGTTVATLAVSVVIGVVLTWRRWLPGTTALWGAMPGAATAMVLMARENGADARLVAVMSYVRVACVAALASILSVLLAGHGSGAAGGSPWIGAVDPTGVATATGIAIAGAVGGAKLRLPAAALVGPLLLGAALHLAGIRFALPSWLLAMAYAVVGWRIGLSFTREIVAVAARALPRILLATGATIVASAGLAMLLAHVAGVSPVTAYLATSPGGMDSVAIIAAETPVDVSFVMAMQALRFFAVLAVGPALARLLAHRFADRDGRASGQDAPTG
ncbi:hypothetical protein SAMN05192583_1269 [Sphingomonas gellani]|uniref:Ammonia monooxygenase n=1 Tax=Sphingomonas gellani TaxID=1166340 RepID=A0A1H8BC23_9SPHN|nr:AbrB family transcriptional regulator [Sphingomonas gellani]SEM79548.1 hypothetical protein SAMN05192583_1269 [Sphingomonas gellani]